MTIEKKLNEKIVLKITSITDLFTNKINLHYKSLNNVTNLVKTVINIVFYLYKMKQYFIHNSKFSKKIKLF